MKEFTLSNDELAAYEKDGFLIRESVFNQDEVKALCLAAELAEKKAQELSENGSSYILDGKRFVDHEHITIQFEPEIKDAIKVIEPVHELSPYLDKLLDEPRIVDPIRSILKTEDISLWTDKLNLKVPGGSGFGWHQDSPYWIHDSEHVDLLTNVYLSFDDSEVSNGCLRVIKASHLKGCLAGKNDGTQLGGFYTNEDAFDEKNAIDLVLKAGSIVFFNAHSIHGSLVNNSTEDRRAMVITYQPSGYPALKSKVERPIIAL